MSSKRRKNNVWKALKPHSISSKLGCAPESSSLRPEGPTRAAGGGRGQAAARAPLAWACPGPPLRVIWSGLASLTLSTWVFRAQPVFAGVLVLLFVTAGSAPLGPHVKPCGNAGRGEWGVDMSLRSRVGAGEAGRERCVRAGLTVRPGWREDREAGASLMEPACRRQGRPRGKAAQHHGGAIEARQAAAAV